MIRAIKVLLKNMLVYFPLLLLLVVSYLKWQYFEKSYYIFIIASVLCILLGLFLIIYSRVRYKTKIRSLAATLLSLLAMQKVAGFSLVVVSALAFTWLIDYIREFPILQQSTEVLIAGAVFSASLMFIVVGIVVFIEKQKLNKLRQSSQESPLITRGLILSLSMISNLQVVEELSTNLNKIRENRQNIRRILKIVLDLESIEQLDNIEQHLQLIKIDKQSIALFKILSSTQLYPLLLAIEHHSEKLEQVWILTTPEAKRTSLSILEKLVHTLFKGIKIRKVDIDDPDNVNMICKKVDEVYIEAQDFYNFDENDVTADITSGPASATAGIILACVRSKRQVQYLGRRQLKLQAVEVNVGNIPRLFDEIIDQIEMIRASEHIKKYK